MAGNGRGRSGFARRCHESSGIIPGCRWRQSGRLPGQRGHPGHRRADLVPGYPARDPPRRIREHLQHGVSSLAGMEVNSRIRIRSGQPVEEILAEAREHDVMVVGGHGPQVRSLFGVDDVAMRIMNQASNHVLVIPVE